MFNYVQCILNEISAHKSLEFAVIVQELPSTKGLPFA